MKSTGWDAHPWKIVLSLLLLITLSFTLLIGSVRTGQAQVPAQKYKLYLPSVRRGPPPPNAPPLASTSYYFYMRYYTAEKARSFGCLVGQRDATLPGKQDTLVVLDFGITKEIDGKYGASGMQIGGFVTLSKVAEAVEQFGLGYWDCTDMDYVSHLRIGIGTNNYNNNSVYSDLSVDYGHGKAWAQMVNQVNDWFVKGCPNGCDGQVDAVGANDIELAWSSPAAAIDWVNGYDSANLYPLYNFGAAEGCPNFCGGGGYTWTKEQVFQVTNGGPVYSVPEIYLNSGANASQWYQLSLYSVSSHGYPYNFMGVMTTYGACQQYPEESCQYIDNTPSEGWTQLYNLVNSRTSPSTWDDLPYVTDIQWTE